MSNRHPASVERAIISEAWYIVRDAAQGIPFYELAERCRLLSHMGNTPRQRALSAALAMAILDYLEAGGA